MSEKPNQLIGRDIIYLSETDSTNEHVRRLLEAGGLAAGTVVVAEQQTQGKGRAGREWESPPGGLWFSVLMKPKLPLERMALLSLVFAVAISQALNKYAMVNCQLKWPNDIYIKGKKLAGILLEAGIYDEQNYLIAGIGINMNLDKDALSPANWELAASLSDYSPKHLDRLQILETILQHLDLYYTRFAGGRFNDILREYKSRCFHLNQQVSINRAGKLITGINIDIDDSGRLILDVGNKIEAISTGDVHVLQ